MSLMYTWSRHMFAELVRAGREWEEETAMPSLAAASRSTTTRTDRTAGPTARRVPATGGPTPADRRMRTLFRHPRRVGRVVAVFFGLFIAPALHLPGADKRPGPVRLRLAFEHLGGAWVKLGQMLALRYDLLPVAYCDELFRLLNQVAPFSYDEVRRDHPPGAGRGARGRLRLVRARSRSPRRRSARCIAPSCATGTGSRSRSSGRTSGRRSRPTST